MKKLVIAFAIMMLTLIISPIQAQNVILSINPTSGPTGTVVSFTINAPFATPVRECYANNVFIGDGSPYAIPAEAQGTITFYCDAGLGGEFNERSNDAFFTVTQPQQPASITISINPTNGTPPINVAVTIQTTGNANANLCTANGVPFNPPNYVVPEGAQGIVTFQCQDQQLQIFSNQAIFTISTPGQPQPTQPPAPTQPSAPTITLPTLPNDGVCYVATDTTNAVNVRQEPDTDAPIVASMNPELFYVATEFAEVGESRWYFIPVLGGWVAGFVVRATAPCADITPQTTPVDLPSEFDDCPFVHEYLADFPPYVINSLLDAEVPCDAAFDLVNDRLFGTAVPLDLPMGITIDEFLADCPERFFQLEEALSYLLEHDFITGQTLLIAIEERGCEVDIYTDLSPEFFGGDIGIGLMFVYECNTPASRAIAVGNTLATLGFSGLDIRYLAPCTLVRFVDTPPLAVQRLFDYMVTPTCGIDRTQALWYLVFAHVNRIHPVAILDHINLNAPASERAFCDNPRQYIENMMDTANTVLALNPSTIPHELRDCPELAQALSHWRNRSTGDGIDLPNLVGILSASNPCETAQQFLDGEAIPTTALDSSCAGIDEAGSPFILVGGEQVTSQSSWAEKLQALRQDSTLSFVLDCDALAEQVLGFPPSTPRVCYAVSYWFESIDPVMDGIATVNIYTNGPSALGAGDTAEYRLINPVSIRIMGASPHHLGFVTWMYDDTGGYGRPFVAWRTTNAQRMDAVSWDGIVDDSLCAIGGRPVMILPDFRFEPAWVIEPIDPDILRIPLEIPPIPPFEPIPPFPNLTEILIGLLPRFDDTSPFAGMGGDTLLRDRLLAGDLFTIERTLYMALESRCDFEEYDIYQILYFANTSEEYTPEDFADLLRVIPDDACDGMRQLTSGTFALEDGTPFLFFGLDGLPFGVLNFIDEDMTALREAISRECGIEADQMNRAIGALIGLGVAPEQVLQDLTENPSLVCFGLRIELNNLGESIQELVAQCLLNEEDTRLGIRALLVVTQDADDSPFPFALSGRDMLALFAYDIEEGCRQLRETIDRERRQLELGTLTIRELLQQACEFTPEEVERTLELIARLYPDTVDDELREAIIFSYACAIMRDQIASRDTVISNLMSTCGVNLAQADLIVTEIERKYETAAYPWISGIFRSYGVAGCADIILEAATRDLFVGTIQDVCGFTATQAEDSLTTLESTRSFSYLMLFTNLIEDTERMCGQLGDLIGLVTLVFTEIAYDIPVYIVPSSPTSSDSDTEEATVGADDMRELTPVDHGDGDDTPEITIIDTDDIDDLLADLLTPPSDTPPSDTPPSDTPPSDTRIIVVTDTSIPRNEKGVPVRLAGLPTDPQATTDFINASGLAQTGFTMGVVQVDEDDTSNIYLLVNGELELLFGDLPGSSILPAIHPTGDFIAFFQQSDEGKLGLFLADISQGTPHIRQIDIGIFELLPAVMSWTPDGADLLISVMDNTGTPAIYALEGMPNPTNWRLVVQNGTSPAIESGGRYMAFIRDGALFSIGVNGGTARFVHSDEQGCANPTFGADPFVLYFTCGNVAYRYDSTGVNALALPNVTHITTGGINGIITFSDGETLFIAVDDGSQPQPLIRQAGANVRYFNWLR